MDKEGKPLRPAFVWLDNRKAEGKPKYSQLTRLMLKAVGMDQTAIMQYRKGQCNWMMEKEPETWKKTYKYLMISGYLIFKLTGRMVDCAASMVGRIPFDHRARNWQKKGALTRPVFDIEPEKLCDIAETGEVMGEITGKAAADTGLRCGLPSSLPVPIKPVRYWVWGA